MNHFTVMEYVDPVWKPWLLHARPNAFDPGIDLLDLAPTVLVKNLLSWVEQGFLGSVLGSAEEPEERLQIAA